MVKAPTSFSLLSFGLYLGGASRRAHTAVVPHVESMSLGLVFGLLFGGVLGGEFLARTRDWGLCGITRRWLRGTQGQQVWHWGWECSSLLAGQQSFRGLQHSCVEAVRSVTPPESRLNSSTGRELGSGLGAGGATRVGDELSGWRAWGSPVIELVVPDPRPELITGVNDRVLHHLKALVIKTCHNQGDRVYLVDLVKLPSPGVPKHSCKWPNNMRNITL